MGLFQTILMSACVAGTNGNSMSQTACQKAADAGGQQSGITKQADTVEKKTLNSVQTEAVKDLGENSVMAVAGSVFLVKTVTSKSLSIGLPTLGLCSSVKTEIKTDQAMLKLEWKF